MNTRQKISADEVIDRILDLITAVPGAAEGLPEGCRTKAFWQQVFAANEYTGYLMEVLRELPAFTNQAPAPGDTAGWVEVLKKDFKGPPQARPKQEAMILKKAVDLSKAPPGPPYGPSLRAQAAKPEVEVKPTGRWRDRFGPDQIVQRVRPVESDEYIPNPHRGTTTFQRFQGDGTYATWSTSDTHGPIEFAPDAPVQDNVKYIPRTTLTYCRWPWRWLEPEKGKFRWDLVQQTLKTAHNRGQTVQLRFQPYTRRVEFSAEPINAMRHPPERSVNVPDWYWDTGAPWVEKGVYAPNEPDSNHPLYIKHFGDFVRAFAKKFDGHPDLESIDIAYAGFWGESGGNSTPATGAKLTDIYLKSFKKTQLLSMIGTDGCKYAAAKARAANRRIGWRADCFGDLHLTSGRGVPHGLSWNHTLDAYPKLIQTNGVKDAWMTAPVTMETCGNVATWFMDGYDLDTIFREGYRYHMSVFMPKNVFFPAAWMDKLIEFDKKIGYRFVLRQLLLPLESKAGGRIKLEFFFDNVGCAPIYRPYKLAMRFTQGPTVKIVRLKQDIRTWMPGHTWFEETIPMPKGLKKGEARLDLAIVDEDDKPKVWLAIKEKSADGWHPMTSIDIV